MTYGMASTVRTCVVYRIEESFKGEHFSDFHCFVFISESFLCKSLKAWWTVGSMGEQSINFSLQNLIFHQFTKVFSLERFNSYMVYNTCTYNVHAIP